MSQSPSASDAFNDSLDFVKKLWGSMGVPGMQQTPSSSIPGMAALTQMAVPSMTVEDLDRRISDLKTVEAWLTVNSTMLRNTIQALEVQRATIATLHSLSATMANTMQGITDPAGVSESHEPAEDSAPASPLIAQSAAWWQGVQDQFKQALGAALDGAAMTVPPAANAPATPKAASRPKARPAAKPAARSKSRSGSSRSKSASKSKTA